MGANEKGAASSGGQSKLNAAASGKAADVKSQAIRGATDAGVDKAVGGDPDSAKNQYTKAAAAGAVQGASVGGLHGAAVGAAKGAGGKAAEDTIGKTSKNLGLDSADDKKGKDKDQDKDDTSSDEKKEAASGKDGADKALGAGGTSYERDHGEDDADGGGKGTAKKLAIGGAAAAATTPAAGAILMLLMIMAWLKSMFFQMLSMVLGLWQAIWAGVKAVAAAVWGAITAPFSALASFFTGIGAAVFGAGSFMASVAAGTVVAALVAIFSFGGIGAAIAGAIYSQNAAAGDGIGSSKTCYVSTAGAGGDSSVPTDAQTEANAQLVYSVFSTWGMSDVNIAGILGNWQQESGIDSTRVQTIENTPFAISEEEKTGAQTLSNGIGLGQWTAGRNQLLRDWSAGKGVNWWDVGTQLAFMYSGDSAGDVRVFTDMIATPQASPAAAAKYYHDEWERSADDGAAVARRGDNADAWYGKMSGWTVDRSAAKTLIGDLLDGSEKVVGSIAKSTACNNGGSGDVSLKDDGLNQEEAQALVDLYNQEGDAFLDGRYGAEGGPGSCNGNHAMNCVSFSTYWLNKYTTFQNVPNGNGIDIANSVSEGTSKEQSSTPTAYSVGSGPGSGSAGHTFVVLGIEGNNVIVGEAGWCEFMGRVTVKTVEELQSAGWKFVDMSDSLLPTPSEA